MILTTKAEMVLPVYLPADLIAVLHATSPLVQVPNHQTPSIL